MPLSAETIWRSRKKELINLLSSGIFTVKPKMINFFAPSFMYYNTSCFCSLRNQFPTISVTGKSCTLKCKHCGGKVLETMEPVSTPEKLFELAKKLKKEGTLGCLVSGGCLPNGTVPLEKFLTAIKKIKRELGLTIFVHTGIISSKIAFELKDAGVDAALIDVIGSRETIKKVYNLNITPEDYLASMNALHEADLNFIPHLIVGLNYGKLKGEMNALKLIVSANPSALVIIAFMPIHGTPMARVNPPQPTDIAKVIAIARVLLSKTPIVLGCMRPKGKHRAETDILALKAGVNGIAFPSEEAIEYAKLHDYKFSFSSYCCSQIYANTTLRSSSK